MDAVSTNTSSSVPMMRPAFFQPFFCLGSCSAHAPARHAARAAHPRRHCALPGAHPPSPRFLCAGRSAGCVPKSRWTTTVCACSHSRQGTFLSLLMFLCILFVPGSKFTYQSTIRNILPYLSNAKEDFCRNPPVWLLNSRYFPHSTDFQSDRWQKLPNVSTCVFSSFRVYYGYKDKGGLSHERGIRPQLHHPDRRGRQRH